MPHVKTKFLGQTAERIEEQREERVVVLFMSVLKESEKTRSEKFFLNKRVNCLITCCFLLQTTFHTRF